jgi:hypothetical protein
MRAPPPAIDSAHVLYFASAERDVQWTGKQVLYVDDKLLGPVPRLAICRNLYGQLTDHLLFHCDRRWTVLGVGGAKTLAECREQAERAYSGISNYWQKPRFTRGEARRWSKERWKPWACSFCGRLPPQVDRMFSARSARACDICVKDMARALAMAEAGAGDA